jgi:hypothetical protein
MLVINRRGEISDRPALSEAARSEQIAPRRAVQLAAVAQLSLETEPAKGLPYLAETVNELLPAVCD